MNLSAQFKEYLISQSNPPSLITVKNYISDINKFIRWIEARLGYDFNPSDINQSLIDKFKAESLSTYSASSVERSLSSLRKFFYFLKLEGKISQTPFEVSTIKTEIPDPWKIKEFKNHLYVFGASHLTIKNYIIDVKQFLTWADEVVKTDEAWEITRASNFSKITSGLIEEYKTRLLDEAHLSPVSVNRKLSSIRRFISWANEEGLIKDQAEVVNLQPNDFGFKAHSAPILATTMTAEAINEANKTQEYSAFPPLRVAQKTKEGAMAAFDTAVTAPLADALDKSDELVWNLKGRPVFKEKLKASFKIPSFKMIDPKKINNVPKSFYAPAMISTANFPLHKKVLHHARHSRPKWYKTYHSYAFVSYLHFSILMLFISAMGYMVFNDFNTEKQTPTFAALPSAPPRILSFQGRLTDANDNPITKGTTLRMSIYNNQTATGSALLWQEIVSPTPDEEGIFSILLGNNNPIPQSLFAQNSGLWLGVTVERTQELKPRQQIATVAFAANAETLQGLPPITNTSATSNVVLALNSSGNLTIGGTANPIFQATGGTFTVSGRTLILTTSNNGNIRLAPNGTGIIDIQKSVQNTTNSGLVVPGSVTIEDLFSVVATSSGQAVLNISQGSTGDLIIASTSGSTKFRIDNGGNLIASGSLNGLGVSSGTINSGTWHGATIEAPYGGTGQTSYSIGDILYASDDTQLSKLSIGSTGDCLISNGVAPSWGTCTGSGTVGIFSQSSGAIYANNSTVDFLIGGQSSTSAKFAILNIDGSRGSQTASLSGNIALDSGSASIESTNGQTLTLGGSNTGFINLDSGSGIINLLDNVEIAGALGISGLATFNGGVTVPSGQTTTLASFANNGGILYTNASGVIAQTGIGSLGECFISNGGGAPSWGSCVGSGGTNWNITEGSIYPKLASTLDFLIGGTSSESAKFAILNVNGARGSQIGTLSGSLTLDSSTASIQTTNNQTLTIGGNTTGDINFMPGSASNSLYLSTNGNVGINNSDPVYKLDILGTSGTNNLISIKGNAGSNIGIRYTDGASSALAGLLGDDCSGGNTWTIKYTGGGCYFNVHQNGNVEIIGNLSGLTGLLSSGLIGFNTSSPLGTLDVNPNSNNGGTISIASISGSTSFAALLTDNSGTGDLFTASKSGATKFVINNNGYVGIASNSASRLLDVGSIGGDSAYFSGNVAIKNPLLASGGFLNTLYTISNPGTGYEINDNLTASAGGDDAQFTVNGIDNVTITASNLSSGGLGYEVNDILTLSGGNNDATLTVDSVNGNGTVTSYTLNSGGTGYLVPDSYEAELLYKGSNLIPNPDMELDSNWGDEASPLTNERSTEQVHGGTYSRKYVTDASWDGIKSDTFTTVTGARYRLSYWVYAESTVVLWINRGDNGGNNAYNAISITPSTWTNIIWDYTEAGGGSNAYVAFSSGGTTVYVDDTSLRRFGDGFELNATNGSGSISNLTIVSRGTDFSTNIPYALTGGSGSNGEITLNTAYGSSRAAISLLNLDGTSGLEIRSGGWYYDGDQINNTFVGMNSGALNISGNHNTSLGEDSLYSNQGGSNNNAIGYQSLYANVSGSGNNALGKGSLESNLTGNSNNAIGQDSLSNNLYGSYNVALGDQTLSENIGGELNIGIGSSALANNRFGENNIGIGTNSMLNLDPRNSTITQFSDNGSGGTTVTSGSHDLNNGDVVRITGTTHYDDNWAISNVTVDTFDISSPFLGDDATGYWSNVNQAYGNAALGSYSGNGLTTGHSNTFLGYNSDTSLTNAINTTTIGADSFADCSNCIILGSINSFNDATSDVNVGIGTTDPIAKLEVNGSAREGGNALAIFNQTGTDDIFTASVSGVTKFVINNSGNVGIGIASPGAALDIFTKNTTNKGIIVRGAAIPNVQSGLTSYWKFDDNSGSTVTESTGNYNGTWHGTLGSQWDNGIINSGGIFNGSDNYVESSSAITLANTSFTISTWVKTSSPNSTMPIASNFNNSCVANGFFLGMRNGKFQFTGGHGCSVEHLVSNSDVPNNEWALLTVTYTSSSNSLKMYIDGVLDNSTTSVSDFNSGGGNFEIGIITSGCCFFGGTLYFNGSIDEMGVWNRDLSQSEVSTLYGSGLGNQYPFAQLANLQELQDYSGSVLSAFDSTGKLGLGTSSPISELHVTRPLSFGATGKALAIFDQIENQDIFTASKSGTPVFAIGANGEIKVGSGLLSSGSLNNCLLSGGTGSAPSWGSCGSGGSSNWRISSGAISPINNTLDLLIGGQSTASSKFAFTNVNSGTPTLKIFNSTSANSLNLYHDGTDAHLETSSGQVVIGNGTGNVVIEDSLTNDTANNSGFLKIADKFLVQNSENSALVVFDNLGSGDIFTGSTSGTTKFVINNGGDITFAGGDITNGTASLDIGEALSGDISITGDFIPSADNSYTLGSSSSSWNTLFIKGPFNLNGNNGVSGQCLLSGGSGAATWGNCQTLANNYWQLNSNLLSPVNSTYDFAIGGTATTAAKFAFLNVAGGTPTASISANSGNGATFLSGGGQLGTTNRQALFLGNSAANSTTGDVFINSNASSTTFRVAIGTTDTTSSNSLTVGGSSGDLIRLTGGTNLISESAFVTFQSRGRFGYDGSLGAVVLSDANASKPIIFMAGGPSVEKFRIAANLTSASASVSGSTSFAGLVVDNSFASGDIFTASKSGKTHFVIDRAGNVGIGNSLPQSRLEIGANSGTGIDEVITIRSQGRAGLHLFSDTSDAGSEPGGAYVLFNDDGLTTTNGAIIGTIQTANTDPSGTAFSNLDTNSFLIGLREAQDIQFGTNSTASMILSATNLLGLGTTAPTSQFYVTRPLSFGATGKALAIFDQIENQDIFTASKSGTTVFKLDSIGNAAFGTVTTIPSESNLVLGYHSTTEGGQIQLNPGSGGSTAYSIDTFADHFRILTGTTTSTSTTRINMTNAGFIGIGMGDSDPSFKLDVQDSQAATAAAQFYNTNTGTDADGIVVKLGNTATTTSTTNHWISFEQAGIGIVGSIQGNGSKNVNYKTNGIADFAEYLDKDPNQNIDWGTVVCQNSSGKIAPCSGTNSSIVGVASEFPTFTGGTDKGDASITVGLTGLVATRVSTSSGVIKSGDFITASSFDSGLGVKASNAGQVVGIALEDFSGNGTGKILVKVGPTFYDPDIQLADSGYLTLAPTIDDNFEVKRQTGETVNRIGAFSEIITAKIKSGYFETGKLLVTGSASVKNLTTETLASTIGDFSQLSTESIVIGSENISIAGQSLREYIASIVEDVVGEQEENTIIVAPILATDVITPKTGKTLAVKLNSDDSSSSFEIQNLSGKTIAAIDALGNASLSGELKSDSITTNDATISGTLRATKIIADQIEGLNIQASSVSANYITNNYYAASSSAQSYQATGSASFDNLVAMRATFEQGLMAFGPASFYEASVADRLFVGSKLSLADTSINVLGGNLELQPLRQGGVSLVGGLIEIDVDGNLKVDGNAYFAKDVDIKGKLMASFVSPLPGRDFVLELGKRDGDSESENHNSSFVIRNSSASALLSVNNQGDLNASGSGTFNKLNLNIVNKALALSPTEVIATGSAGTAEIQPNREELTIRNSLVTEDSLIYITTKTSTQSESIYLLRQVPGKSFTVGISNPINKKVPFNWIIIN